MGFVQVVAAAGAGGRWMDHHDGWPWGVVMLVVLLTLIGLGVWAIVRSTQRRGPHPHDRAREILAERFARGEITPEEYQERVQYLG